MSPIKFMSWRNNGNTHVWLYVKDGPTVVNGPVLYVKEILSTRTKTNNLKKYVEQYYFGIRLSS